jgi:hypothetical protein
VVAHFAPADRIRLGIAAAKARLSVKAFVEMAALTAVAASERES